MSNENMSAEKFLSAKNLRHQTHFTHIKHNNLLAISELPQSPFPTSVGVTIVSVNVSLLFTTVTTAGGKSSPVTELRQDTAACVPSALCLYTTL